MKPCQHMPTADSWNCGIFGKNHMSGLRIVPAEQEGKVFTHQYSLVSRRVGLYPVTHMGRVVYSDQGKPCSKE